MDEAFEKASFEEEVFTLKYDGEALKNHTIDAEELQCAIDGITEFLSAANTVVNGGACTLKIKFGVPKTGCYDLPVIVGVVKELLDAGASVKACLK